MRAVAQESINPAGEDVNGYRNVGVDLPRGPHRERQLGERRGVVSGQGGSDRPSAGASDQGRRAALRSAHGGDPVPERYAGQVKALSTPWYVVLCASTCTAGCQKNDAPPEVRAATPSPPASTVVAPAPSLALTTAAAPVPSVGTSALLPCRGGPPRPAKPPPSGPLHTWGTISYPPIATPWGIGGKAIPVIGSGNKHEGLRFDLSFVGPGNERELSKLPVPQKGELQVLLHTPHGKVAPKCGDTGVGAWVGNQWGASGSMLFIFPWQANDLLEAWIEVRLPEISYWLTVPYGFTRDPDDPLSPPAPSLERPAAPPITAEPGRKAKAIPWQTVSYDLGLITKTWRLSFTQSNPFDASTVVTLYKDDNSRGLLSWSLDSPKTAVRVERGYTVQGIAMSITREDDGMRRTDRFRLNRNPSHDGRFWGTLVVSVDGKDFPVVMPSSLFKYTHGEADLGALGEAAP